MKFRPLALDYHTEAAQLLLRRKQHRQATLWLDSLSLEESHCLDSNDELHSREEEKGLSNSFEEGEVALTIDKWEEVGDNKLKSAEAKSSPVAQAAASVDLGMSESATLEFHPIQTAEDQCPNETSSLVSIILGEDYQSSKDASSPVPAISGVAEDQCSNEISLFVPTGSGAEGQSSKEVSSIVPTIPGSKDPGSNELSSFVPAVKMTPAPFKRKPCSLPLVTNEKLTSTCNESAREVGNRGPENSKQDQAPCPESKVSISSPMLGVCKDEADGQGEPKDALGIKRVLPVANHVFLPPARDDRGKSIQPIVAASGELDEEENLPFELAGSESCTAKTSQAPPEGAIGVAATDSQPLGTGKAAGITASSELSVDAMETPEPTKDTKGFASNVPQPEEQSFVEKRIEPSKSGLSTVSATNHIFPDTGAETNQIQKEKVGLLVDKDLATVSLAPKLVATAAATPKIVPNIEADTNQNGKPEVLVEDDLDTVSLAPKLVASAAATPKIVPNTEAETNQSEKGKAEVLVDDDLTTVSLAPKLVAAAAETTQNQKEQIHAFEGENEGVDEFALIVIEESDKRSSSAESVANLELTAALALTDASSEEERVGLERTETSTLPSENEDSATYEVESQAQAGIKEALSTLSKCTPHPTQPQSLVAASATKFCSAVIALEEQQGHNSHGVTRTTSQNTTTEEVEATVNATVPPATQLVNDASEVSLPLETSPVRAEGLREKSSLVRDSASKATEEAKQTPPDGLPQPKTQPKTIGHMKTPAEDAVQKSPNDAQSRMKRSLVEDNNARNKRQRKEPVLQTPPTLSSTETASRSWLLREYPKEKDGGATKGAMLDETVFKTAPPTEVKETTSVVETTPQPGLEGFGGRSGSEQGGHERSNEPEQLGKVACSTTIASKELDHVVMVAMPFAAKAADGNNEGKGTHFALSSGPRQGMHVREVPATGGLSASPAATALVEETDIVADERGGAGAELQYTFNVPIDEETAPSIVNEQTNSDNSNIAMSKKDKKRKERKLRKKEKKDKKRKKKRRMISAVTVKAEPSEKDDDIVCLGVRTSPGQSFIAYSGPPQAVSSRPAQPTQNVSPEPGTKKETFSNGIPELLLAQQQRPAAYFTEKEHYQIETRANLKPQPTAYPQSKHHSSERKVNCGQFQLHPTSSQLHHTNKTRASSSSNTRNLQEAARASKSNIAFSTPRNCFATMPPVQLLCSETFIEAWGEVLTELVAGRWPSSVFRPAKKSIPVPDSVMIGRRLAFCDTSILGACGVDIELPDRRGLIVQSLSTWGQDGRSAREFITRLLGLAALGRYKSILCILCCDGELLPLHSKQILKVQNAFAGDECPTKIHVQVSGVLGLSYCMAQAILQTFRPESLTLYQQVLNELPKDGVSMRASFLAKLVTTLTAIDAIQCVTNHGQSNTEDEFQLLFCSKIARSKLSSKGSGLKGMLQLAHILAAPLNMNTADTTQIF